jgi:hypothetical protein
LGDWLNGLKNRSVQKNCTGVKLKKSNRQSN